MKERFIISTTNNIENGIIKQYIDVVCSNVVVGTNFFSDLKASITDLLGGKSDSYRRKLEYIYQEATKDLKNKALKMGANAIIGFSVDFDEISGKDKSMFMVSVTGTACKVELARNLKDEYNNIKINNTVSQFDLDKEIKRRLICKGLRDGHEMEIDWMQFLIENPQEEIIGELVNLYCKYKQLYQTNLADNVAKVLVTYPKSMMIPAVYNIYEESNSKDLVMELFEYCNWFDASSILDICSYNIHEGVKFLSLKSDYYNADDLSILKQIYNLYQNLPDTGEILKVKSGVFNKKEEDKFICEQGHSNPVSERFCSKCSLDIKGFCREEVSKIEEFKIKVDILSEMMKRE